MVSESSKNTASSGEIDQSWQSVLLKLAQYLQPGDYISHLSALHLRGFYPKSCEIISVVSGRRHRNRLIEGKQVQFVCRKKMCTGKQKGTSSVFASIQIAEPGRAWVDLLADLDSAPPIDILANLAQIIPMNVADTLKKAELISDTVLKRAIFFLGWCGRLQSFKSLNNRLSDSPAKLDFRVTSNKLLWDSRCKIFFPCEILEKKVDQTLSQSLDWLIFRNSPGFINALKRKKALIFRKESSFTKDLENVQFPGTPVELDFLREWFSLTGISGISLNLTLDDLQNLGEWVNPLIDLALQKDALLETAKQNSPQILQDMDLCSRLFVVFLALKNCALIEYCLRNWGETLFYYGKSSLISLAYPLIKDFNISGMAIKTIITLALFSRGNLADANSLWRKAHFKQPFCGLYYMTNAVSAHRNGYFAEAEKDYLQAISVFNEENNFRMAEACRIHYGNLFLGLKQFSQAKAIYLDIWKNRAKGIEISNNFKGVLIGNLGIAEFRLGNLRRSEKLLLRALPLAKNSANEGAMSLFLYFLAHIKLSLGKPVQGIALARESWNLRQKTGNTFASADNVSLIILLNQIIGRHEEAAYWMGLKEVGVERPVYLLGKGYELLFKGETSQALIQFKKAEQIIEAAPNSLLPARINSIIAMICLKNKDHTDNSIKEIFKYQELASIFPDGFHIEVVKIMLIEDLASRQERLGSLLEKFCKAQFFDPLWFLVFELIRKSLPGPAAKFLESQFHLSPYFIKSCAKKYFHNNGISCQFMNEFLLVDEKEYVYVNSQELSLIGRKKYLELKENSRNLNNFFFDGVTGEVFIHPGKSQVRKSSVQARMLSFILQSRSGRVPIQRVYEAVWKTAFYEDFDLAVIKTTVARLNQFLNSRFTSIQLKVISVSCRKFVEVKLPQGWQAVLPLQTF